jgi:hypothetical protein
VIDAGGLVGPAPGNPKGHYEDAEMMALQRGEFIAQRRRSRGWQLIRPEFLRFSPQGRKQATELVQSRNARFDQWGWKDPRSLPFLPQWQELQPGLRVVLLWRPVADVTGSLLRRATGASNKDFQIGARRAVATWIAYNELARRFKIDNADATMVLPLSRALRDGSVVIEEMNDRLGMTLQPTSISSHFEPDLLRASDGDDVLGRPSLRRLAREGRALEDELERLSAL